MTRGSAKSCFTLITCSDTHKIVGTVIKLGECFGQAELFKYRWNQCHSQWGDQAKLGHSGMKVLWLIPSISACHCAEFQHILRYLLFSLFYSKLTNLFDLRGVIKNSVEKLYEVSIWWKWITTLVPHSHSLPDCLSTVQVNELRNLGLWRYIHDG